MRAPGAILIVSLLAMLAATVAHAERRVALVMADDSYRSLRTLENAVRDGRAIEAALDRLGFEVFSESNRDLRRMRRALDDFREDAAGADVALVYFAGHGVEIGGENRLLPIDADASSLARLKETSLPLEDITREVASIGKVGLVVLDACRNDPFGASSGSGGRGAVALAPEVERSVKPGLGRIGKAENVLFAFSAAPGETASDGDAGNSPFTAALAKYIATDGLEIRSVMTLVQQEVYDATRGKQLPYIESGLPRLFFASSAAGTLPERERLLMAMADVTPQMRQEVEEIAQERQMPLAPLYAALISSDAASLDAIERGRKLAEAAESFLSVQSQLKTMSATDPKVADLRSKAEASITLGAFDEARGILAQAAAIDSQSREALKTNFVERTLSEAATYGLSASAARATLRYDRAIEDFRRAVALYTELGGASLTPDAADRYMTVLSGLGDLSTTVGDIAGAGRSYDALRALMERRAKEDADPLLRRNLAVALTKLGNARLAEGNLDAALASQTKALSILEALTEGPSPNPEWLSSRAVAEDKISEVLVARGDLGGAASASRSALEIKRKLLAPDGSEAQALRDLTITYDALGDVLKLAGDFNGALEAYDASLDIRNDLVARDGDNPERRRDLWVSHDNIGNMQRELSDPVAAQASFEAGREQIMALIARDPQNTELVRDLSVTESKIGNVRRDQSDLAGARTHFAATLDIVRDLTALDPSNATWRRDLSVALEKVADLDQLNGDTAAALKSFEESLVIMRSLAASDPTNANWQRDLSITLGETGNLRLASKDVQGAGDALTESLSIRQRLAESDPANALWQRDLVIAYADYAQVAKRPVAVLQQALDLALSLQEEGRLGERYGFMIDVLHKRLDKARRHARK